MEKRIIKTSKISFRTVPAKDKAADIKPLSGFGIIKKINPNTIKFRAFVNIPKNERILIDLSYGEEFKFEPSGRVIRAKRTKKGYFYKVEFDFLVDKKKVIESRKYFKEDRKQIKIRLSKKVLIPLLSVFFIYTFINIRKYKNIQFKLPVNKTLEYHLTVIDKTEMTLEDGTVMNTKNKVELDYLQTAEAIINWDRKKSYRIAFVFKDIKARVEREGKKSVMEIDKDIINKKAYLIITTKGEILEEKGFEAFPGEYKLGETIKEIIPILPAKRIKKGEKWRKDMSVRMEEREGLVIYRSGKKEYQYAGKVKLALIRAYKINTDMDLKIDGNMFDENTGRRISLGGQEKEKGEIYIDSRKGQIKIVKVLREQESQTIVYDKGEEAASQLKHIREIYVNQIEPEKRDEKEKDPD